MKLNAENGHTAAERGAAVYVSARGLIIGAIIVAGLLSVGAGIAIILGVAAPVGRTTDPVTPAAGARPTENA